jgi:cytoskeletal protein CcmA (bactofilin family)
MIESIDAAASSLQLGTDILETQVVEIGSADVTTTIYGPVNIIHAMNASSLTLDYDLNVGGNTLLHNLSAAELTSTRVDTGTVNATSLNVDGITLLGTLYAGNCSLMNVSAARIDAEQLTVKGNCSMSNVSVLRLDANALMVKDTVTAANLNIVNRLTSAPIPTAYTIATSTVGIQIPLSSLTSVNPNGVIGPSANGYAYTSTNVPEFNTVNGTLNTTYQVFAQTTYRVCISVNYVNNAANLSFQDGAGTLYTLGLSADRTIYILYLKATFDSPLYLTVFRSATSGSVEIELDSLSVEPWCETNVTTLNATGSALLASSGGVVGIGTNKPLYTLDVSGSKRVTGDTTIHNLTVNGTINSPPKIGYATPTKGQAGLNVIGGCAQYTSSFTITTTTTAQAATEVLIPNGRYFMGIYLYIPPTGAIGEITTKLAYNSVTFTSGATTGFLSALTDGQTENYGYKPTNTLAYSLHSNSIQDLSGVGYLGIAVKSANSIAGCKLVFTLLRIA